MKSPLTCVRTRKPACPHACAAGVSADLDVRRLLCGWTCTAAMPSLQWSIKLPLRWRALVAHCHDAPTAGAAARMLSCYVCQGLQGCPVGAALMLPPEATAQCVHALAARVLHALPCIHGFFLRIMWKLTCSGDRIPGNSLNIRHY